MTAWTREKVTETFNQIVAEASYLDPDAIRENDRFGKDLGLDSLDQLNIAFDVENIIKGVGSNIDAPIVSANTVGEAIDAICFNLGIK
jgi:acyl carrier protein